jgi:ferric-dicitrate binding protein FerR (iron transport regulator)
MAVLSRQAVNIIRVEIKIKTLIKGLILNKVKTTITKELLTRYLAGHCTPAEEQLVKEWYDSFEELSPYFENENSEEAIELKTNTKATIQSIIANELPHISRVRKIISYSSVAAAILVLLMAGLYWMLSKEGAKKIKVAKAPVYIDSTSITPGTNKAVLTLADGSKVVLDNAANGMLAQQNNVQVVKSKDGELKYQPANSNGQTTIAYNMLLTPRGGQYRIALPDGSTVWLNAASSIRFPTAFIGNERNVEITGEAYFEVKKNASMPFTVKMNNGTVVKVLGTHFNINAYDDEESIKTTLLEGSVEVSSIGNRQSAILNPGEQVSLSHESQLSQPIPVQTDEVMAWKNGLFQFNNVTIETVMRQVARWYDVQVVYERDVSQDLFRGKIYRNAAISQLLTILELGGAHFKIEGKKIIVQ